MRGALVALCMETYSPSLGRFAMADSQRAVLPIEPALW